MGCENERKLLQPDCHSLCCRKRHASSPSDTAVVRAPGYNGSSFPLHSEEWNRSEKPKYHHDQELPMEEKVVTVEKCHGCTNGLRIKKTNHKMHTRDPGPTRSPTTLGPVAFCGWQCSLLFVHPDGTSCITSSQTCPVNSCWELVTVK